MPEASKENSIKIFTIDKIDDESTCLPRSKISDSVPLECSAGNTDGENRIEGLQCIACSENFETRLRLADHICPMAKDKSLQCPNCNRSFLRRQGVVSHIRFCKADKLICKICKKKFSDRTSIKRHLQRHTNTKPFQCTICYKKFLLKYTLKMHFRIHTGEKPYMCSVCGKKYTCKRSLASHSKIHSSVKEFKCQTCQSSFSRVTNYLKHEEKGCKPRLCDKKRFNSICCAACKENLETISSLKEHTCPEAKYKKYKCNNCNMIFVKSQAVVNHIKYCKVDGLICMICTKKLSTWSCLKQHLQLHTNTKPFQCMICHKKYIKISLLKIHLRVMHTGEKPYVCLVCDKTFPTNGHLAKHSKVHTSVKKFKCQSCNSTFKHKSSYLNHEQQCCKRFACTLCVKTFNRHGSFLSHVVAKHNRSYKCGVCGKKYASETLLSKHITLHKKATQTVCLVCDAEFTSTNELINHCQSHSNMIFHTCQFCLNTFNSYKALENHFQNKHNFKASNKHANVFNQCKKTFSPARKSKVHSRPNGSLLFSCDYCEKKFVNKIILIRHVYTIHKKFICNYCLKSFDYNCELKKHECVKSFKCGLCSNVFGFKKHLLNHHCNIHSNKKPYKCNVCFKKFSLSYQFKNHSCILDSNSLEFTDAKNSLIENVVLSENHIDQPSSSGNNIKYRYLNCFKSNLSNVNNIDDDCLKTLNSCMESPNPEMNKLLSGYNEQKNNTNCLSLTASSDSIRNVDNSKRNYMEKDISKIRPETSYNCESNDLPNEYIANDSNFIKDNVLSNGPNQKNLSNYDNPYSNFPSCSFDFSSNASIFQLNSFVNNFYKATNNHKTATSLNVNNDSKNSLPENKILDKFQINQTAHNSNSYNPSVNHTIGIFGEAITGNSISSAYFPNHIQINQLPYSNNFSNIDYNSMFLGYTNICQDNLEKKNSNLISSSNNFETTYLTTENNDYKYSFLQENIQNKIYINQAFQHRNNIFNQSCSSHKNDLENCDYGHKTTNLKNKTLSDRQSPEIVLYSHGEKSTNSNFLTNACKVYSDKRSNLAEHVFPLVENKNLHCPSSDKSFLKEQDASLHRNFFGMDQFICKVCNKKLSDLWSLYQHYRIHVGEKPYACQVCGKAFQQEHCVTNHSCVHVCDNTKPSSDVNFITRSNVVQDANFVTKNKSVHPLGKESHSISPLEGNPLAYNLSQSSFTEKINLHRPFADHHVVISSDKYKCGICSDKFTEETKLFSHIVLHKKESYWFCLKCTANFSSITELIKHCLSHSNHQPHDCNICVTNTFKAV